MQLKNKTYDVLKDIVQLVLPAAGALYVTLSELWGLPCATEVAGTLAAVATFFGVVLKISSAKYKG